MSEEREKLIRENFEYERDYHYVGFRERHCTLPEIVEACPDERQREQMLRGFWTQDAEGRYAEYRAAVAGASTAELVNEREQWIERLDGVGLVEYRKTLTEAARRPVNDNERGRDR